MLYVKPELRDLSQGSRIAFVRKLRHLSQDKISEHLGTTLECRRRTMTRYENKSTIITNNQSFLKYGEIINFIE